MKITRITASKRDEVLQRKAQYDADLKAYNRRQAESRKNMRAAEDDIIEPLKQYFDMEFADLDALTFEYRIESDWLGHGEAEGIRVHIQCNEHNKFAKDVALAWSYDVRLNSKTGEVVKESSSWSGLSATTPEQMRSLEQTVEALKILNSMDWKAIMSVRMPKYSDFYDFSDKGPERMNFRQELSDATITDAIGTNTWVKVYNWDNSPYYGKWVWVNPVRESGSQFTCNVIDDWTIQEYQKGEANLSGARIYQVSSDRRIRKSSLQAVDPVETIDIPNA